MAAILIVGSLAGQSNTVPGLDGQIALIDSLT